MTVNTVAEPRPVNRSTLAIASVCFMALVITVSLLGMKAPHAVGRDAPPDVFSSGRAMEHVRNMAQFPHPIGSAYAVQSREYLVQRLTELGLKPQIQRTSVVNTRYSAPYSAGTVTNVLVRLEGSGDGKAVLLAAHYDSVTSGPGASDDGVAVAALLETLRVLVQGPQLKNDIIVLFTDGEEYGLLGAKAFTSEHPWVKHVAVALNFEARGTSGPALMFETSSGNGRLIQEFAKAAPYPMATSLSAAVYKLMPNATDFTEFRAVGLAGLGFAHIDSPYHYHTALDNVDNVDERSLQHHGTYALALARHFGTIDLSALSGPDATYFNPWGSLLVSYPVSMALPLALLVSIGVMGTIFLGVRTHQISVRGLAWACAIFLAGVVVSMGVSWIFGFVLGYFPGVQTALSANSAASTVSLLVLVGGTMVALYGWANNRFRTAELAMGAMAVWTVLAVGTGVLLPEGSYLFTCPSLFSAMGLAWLFYTRRDPDTWQGLGLLSICLVPTLLLLSPTLYLVSLALGPKMVALVGGVLAIFLGPAISHLCVIQKGSRRLISIAGFFSVLLAMIVGFTVTAGEQRSWYSLFYTLNVNTNEAMWASTDAQPVPWVSAVMNGQSNRARLTEFYPLSTRTFARSNAPVITAPAPEVVLVEERKEGDDRLLRLRVTSPRGGRVAAVYTDSGTCVLRSEVDGKPVESPPCSPWGIYYSGLPSDGFELSLVVQGTDKVHLRVVDYVDDDLKSAGAPVQTRPAHLIPSPVGPTNSTLIAKSYPF